MSNRTKETLQSMFNQSKLRQQKKKQLKKQQSLQRLKEIYHHQDVLLKKSLQELKKTTMENLYSLIKKRSQEPLKPPTYEFKIYRTDWIERFTDENELFQTIEELKEWEKENYPCINWDVWTQVVEETKKQINQL